MPLIRSNLKPGQWVVHRRGASGAHYTLRFTGSAFLALSRREKFAAAYSTPFWWRRLYTAAANNRAPHGKLVLSAFEDIGIVGKLAVATFIGGFHAHLTRDPLDASDDSSELISTTRQEANMEEVIEVHESKLEAAFTKWDAEYDPATDPGDSSPRGKAQYFMSLLRDL